MNHQEQLKLTLGCFVFTIWLLEPFDLGTSMQEVQLTNVAIYSHCKSKIARLS